jgi:hypothetical protein
MKLLLLVLLVILISAIGFTQNYPQGMPPIIKIPANMTPDMLQMLKQLLPPGTQLPSGMGQQLPDTLPRAAKPLISLPENEPTFCPPVQQVYEADYSPFGSGRNEAQRKAALVAVNA